MYHTGEYTACVILFYVVYVQQDQPVILICCQVWFGGLGSHWAFESSRDYMGVVSHRMNERPRCADIEAVRFPC